MAGARVCSAKRAPHGPPDTIVHARSGSEVEPRGEGNGGGG